MRLIRPPENKKLLPRRAIDEAQHHVDHAAVFDAPFGVIRTAGVAKILNDIKAAIGDEFFAVLSPPVEEAARLQGDPSPRQEASDLVRLLAENARLRKLAVQLSNLLGDLPQRD